MLPGSRAAQPAKSLAQPRWTRTEMFTPSACNLQSVYTTPVLFWCQVKFPAYELGLDGLSQLVPSREAIVSGASGFGNVLAGDSEVLPDRAAFGVGGAGVSW